MEQFDYVVLGASHAGLEALRAIRAHDADGSIAVLDREARLPVSPTVLPYVVSGKCAEDRIALRERRWFDAQRVDYRQQAAAAALDTAQGRLRLADGREIGYGKLLLATGAAPALPPIEGLSDVSFHVLRTLDDALALRDVASEVASEAGRSAGRAVVLGAGLVGMHAAENLVRAGARVTVVEMRGQVLPGYFDAAAAACIEAVFRDKGVEVLTGRRVEQLARRGEGCAVLLDGGEARDADLLLVAAGVRPEVSYLAGSGVAVERGVVVDEFMRTAAANVWAAGDVVQTPSFFGDGTPAGGILPDAVEQGRTAGMSMAGDPALRPYPGGVPLNTYGFFGHRALSVGRDAPEGAGSEWDVLVRGGEGGDAYLKLVLRDGRLQGIFGVDVLFDPGIMWELILRRVEIGARRGALLENPQDTARALMSGLWR
ncbi:NADH-dependent phenylglyoxylate dehydrogenase subunit epsilon [Aromatoleum petrolei]|uniref:NAD(P)/FAD-dependent oxidoreductase n=1 Tax=Aromatoleum petrolei TaxID=76116 RepID=A0ABX1MVU6_9RHOO|nr:NAD(P)/FAD-dependent oxidoreductase [Aromatoleum petrolei]NMF90099.1 NAD(P)/FAD-dependent oxidoreductase [Aromatoleum petrolei]QTQ34219.1 Phenylglyoxylate:acceptor oxidoreductase [Aromatoleum petrolei]